jgi:hypothetical protein
VILSLSRVFRLLGRPFDLAHLRAARDSLSKRDPLHPDLPHIVARIAELESDDRLVSPEQAQSWALYAVITLLAFFAAGALITGVSQ